MAEGILKHYGNNRFFCDSCGINKQPTDSFAIHIMEEVGIQLNQHKPKSFENLEDFSFDLIIALSDDAYFKALDFTQNMSCEVLLWSTDDPSLTEGDRNTVLEAYRSLRTILTKNIQQFFQLSS